MLIVIMSHNVFYPESMIRDKKIQEGAKKTA